VDNDQEFRRSLIKIFTKAGYQVCSASDGNEASEIVNRELFHLIILDLKMPGKTGMDVLREIKEKTPEAKVIVVTAFGDLAKYLEAMDAGAFEFLNKPIKRKVILEYAKRALNNLQN
jgi:DNA-binding NtrC family response regulator